MADLAVDLQVDLQVDFAPAVFTPGSAEGAAFILAVTTADSAALAFIPADLAEEGSIPEQASTPEAYVDRMLVAVSFAVAT